MKLIHKLTPLVASGALLFGSLSAPALAQDLPEQTETDGSTTESSVLDLPDSNLPEESSEAPAPAQESLESLPPAVSEEPPPIEQADSSALLLTDVSNASGTPVRVYGADRYQTAVQAMGRVATTSSESYPNLVIASGSSFADGLTASALAIEKKAVLLLSGQNTVSPQTLAYIQEFHPREVYIVGGPAVISARAENAIRNASGTDAQRLGGSDRYQTSLLVAKQFDSQSTSQAIITKGEDWPDALSAAPLAGINHSPVVLTPGGRTNPSALAAISYLKPQGLTFVGGTWSSGIQNSFASTAGTKSVEVLSGKDRFETNKKVLSKLSNATGAVYTTGYNYADALAGGVLANHIGGAVVLGSRDCSPARVTSGTRYILGGPTVISDKVVNAVCANSPTISGPAKPTDPTAPALNAASYFQYVGSTDAYRILTDPTVTRYLEEIDLNNPGSASSIDNMIRAVEYIQQSNSLRARHNRAPLAVSDAMMASAIASADYNAYKETPGLSHPLQFSTGENIAMTGGNPFDLWYDLEMALYEQGIRDTSVGHYLNIIQPGYTLTGFGIAEKRFSAQSFSGNTKGLVSNFNRENLDHGRVLSAEDYLASLKSYRDQMK